VFHIECSTRIGPEYEKAIEHAFDVFFAKDYKGFLGIGVGVILGYKVRYIGV
jgi:hypothetical protein